MSDDRNDERRGWRVGHRGRDCMYYEEWRDGGWQRLEISGEMLMGRAHHAIYFASPQQWLAYPAWARHRRDEIVARIKSELRPPAYEYHGDGAHERAGTPAATARGGDLTPPIEPARSRPAPGRRKGAAALVLTVALLLSVTAGMGWLVAHGLDRGHTVFPSKLGSQRRSISQDQEPVTFWMALGLYASLGAGTLGLAVWMLRAGR